MLATAWAGQSEEIDKADKNHHREARIRLHLGSWKATIAANMRLAICSMT